MLSRKKWLLTLTRLVEPLASITVVTTSEDVNGPQQQFYR